MKYNTIKGDIADSTAMTSNNEMVVEIIDGNHKGHKAEIFTGKHDCGAFSVDVHCNCGSTWENDLNGCYSYHDRDETGDPELKPCFEN